MPKHPEHRQLAANRDLEARAIVRRASKSLKLREEAEQFKIDSKTGHICRDKIFSCVCKEEKGHDTPHVCKCGGSWEFDINGDFHTIRFPFKNVD